MSKRHDIPNCINKIIFASVLTFSSAGIAFAGQESTIFTYDGQDFIRTQTTIVTEDGKSAINTKLDQKWPAYKALIKKSSYAGEASAFGQKCDAKYAPLIDANGRLTGALFVGMCVKE